MMGVTIVAIAQVAAQDAVDAATRKAILDSARVPVAEALGKPVLFRVSHLGVTGDWAFLRAEMEGPGGQPVDYRGTPLAENAANGAASHTYAALLRRKGAGWVVVDKAIAPTDVAWEGWAAEHRAPPSIFG
jgi:hypothetical protein